LIKVFVVARVRVYRDSVERCLADSPRIVVAGSAAEPAQAGPAVSSARPDVLLLDLGTDAGQSFTREVRTTSPATKVVGLADGAVADVIGFVESGMLGYLPADATLPELVTAIERASRGEATCPPHLAARLFDRLAARAAGSQARLGSAHRLTAREWEILRLIDRGLANKEIARTLSISLSTVKNHVHHLLRKLQVDRRTAATELLRHADVST
jgi:DNA-binding NarL/FixJ family response regulator